MNLTCTSPAIVSIIIILQVSICFGYENNYWVSTLLGSAGRGSKDGDRLTGQVNRPVGVQYYNNSVYITNSEDACIRVFDWQNNYIRTYAGNCYGTGSLDGSLKIGRFLKIRYLTFDGNGTMYVADYCGIRILKDQAMNTFCGSVSTVGYQNGPCSSALFGEVMQIVFFKDEKGGGATKFLVTSHPIIRMIDIQGTVTTYAGNGNPSYQNGPLLSASFRSTSGIVISPFGNREIYVCDQFSNVIRVIINETVSNFAGVPDIAGYLDGPGDVAEFHYPVAIQIDRRGNLYISDAGNNVIRKINCSRYVSTFAGAPGVSETVNGPASKAGFSDPHQIHLFRDTETEFMMLVGGYNTGLVKLLCYGQCFNGVYDCYLQQCTCKKGYFGVDCSLKEGYKVSSSTSMFSSTYYTSLIVDDSNLFSLIITYVSIGVSAMAIIGLVAVGSMSRRNRPKNIPVNDLFSLRSTNSNLKEITVTLQPSKSVISIPGYCQIDPDNDISIESNRILGEGGTGIIYFGMLKKITLISKFGFSDVAVKIIKNPAQTDAKKIDDLKLEVAIMTNIPPSPYITCFVGYSEEPLTIVMKYYPLSLDSFLKNCDKKEIDACIAMKIALEVAQGMKHLHQHGILHLDLKPHNVLLDVDRQTREFRCVICDFGLANFTKESGKSFVTGIKKRSFQGITIRYAAPELITKLQVLNSEFDEESDKKIDVFAYAITLYEVTSEENAWPNLSSKEIFGNVLKGIRPDINTKSIQKFPKILIDLIKACWNHVASERPSFDTITRIVNESPEYVALFNSSSFNQSFSFPTDLTNKSFT